MALKVKRQNVTKDRGHRFETCFIPIFSICNCSGAFGRDFDDSDAGSGRETAMASWKEQGWSLFDGDIPLNIVFSPFLQSRFSNLPTIVLVVFAFGHSFKPLI
jgi:hypothetical protein